MQEYQKPLTYYIRGDGPMDIQAYEQAGGYQALRKALGQMTPKEVTDLIKDSGLRGRGGAGFPTGAKWSFVPIGADAPHPKYLVVNADEMEPGTFKDRLLLEQAPHQLIEGAIISAFAIEADVAYIFLRHEYRLADRVLRAAIAEAYSRGYLGENILGSGWSLKMVLHVSAGRYMCGEETGLLNSLEGKRANPRTKPPFPAVSGLWGKPTVVNNVETISNVAHIVQNGAGWFKELSLTGDAGTKLYGVSGRVKNPGLWEMPMGTPVRQILEMAGGMQEGYQLRAILPGGASTDFILPDKLDTPMDFDSMAKAGSRLGTGTMIILDDRTCPIGMLHNLEQFFAQESCGWCTPCWSGLRWVTQILVGMENGEGQPEDIEVLEEHTRRLAPGYTFCALAPGAAEPLQSGLKFFRDDFDRHIRERRCTYR
ncbi:MAG: NADH-quinone oxidoreductase subunit NuoF [Chloroflexi bacterium]|nr:NADH-quinone oxidoreductase subunit NuoF [Chloroflexota bacterium]